ncbi:MAG: FMN-binding protein [Bacillota bacterium]
MKKVLIIFASIVGIIAIIISIGIIYLNRGLEEGKSVTFEHVDLTTIEDGVYIGSYNHYRFSTTVEVTVENHEIVDLNCLEDVTFANQETWNIIEARVLEQNSYQVDVYTGATVTSNSYLKAIENALLKATRNE